MQNYIGKSTPTKKNNPFTLQGISVGFLVLYIIFSYVAQETLLSPAIHSLIMFCFIGCTALKILSKNKAVITHFTIWQITMIALSFASLLWSNNASMSAVYTMVVALIITFCLISVVDTYERLDMCIYGFIIGCDLMGIMLILTGQLSNLKDGERLGQEVSGNANIFSALLMGACAFTLWKLLYSKKKSVKLFCFISAAFQLVMMIYSGGRKTILAVVICLVWFILAKDISNSFAILKNVFIVAVVLVGIYFVIMNVPLFYRLVGMRFEGLFDFLSGDESNVSSDETRLTLIKIGLEKWTESPILGYGVDSFKYYNKTVTGHFYYAHNNYVEILFDLGIIGFGVYYGFLVHMFKCLYKKWKDNTQYNILGIGLLFLILAYDIGGISFYSTFPLMILSVVYSIINIKN